MPTPPKYVNIPATIWDTLNHGRPWLPQRMDLRRMFENGYSISAIGRALGRAGDAVVARLHYEGLIDMDASGLYVYRDADNTPSPTNPIPQLPAKESTMPAPTPISHVEIKTFINGHDASCMSDDDLFARIEQMEQQIKRWQAIESKPKKLELRIKEAQEAIAKLVEYIDARDADPSVPA